MSGSVQLASVIASDSAAISFLLGIASSSATPRNDNTLDATSSALLALLAGDNASVNASTYQRINDAFDATDAVMLSANLSVLGSTTLGSTSVAGTLLVDGSLALNAYGINTIGETLYLQKQKACQF